MSQIWKLGVIEARFEEPDILYSAAHGETDADSMRQFNELGKELSAKHGRLYLLTNMAESTGMTPEARKISSEGTGQAVYAALAFYGGSFAMRTVVNMMIRAARLLGRQDVPMSFFASEAEARAFLAEEKRKLQSLAKTA